MNGKIFPQALTVAGSDSGGGAGIQADLKTFQMRRVYGTSVITAVTAQNTLGVGDVVLVPSENIAAQLRAVADDFCITAFKTGMLATAEIIDTVAGFVRSRPFGAYVLDPVMVAKGGAPLLQEDAAGALAALLLPLADVVTPNLPEVRVLTGIDVADGGSARQAALMLQEQGAKNVVIKGGHLDEGGSRCTDWLFLSDGTCISAESPRFDTPHTHGTGCTFAACMTAELAKGRSVTQAFQTAKAFVGAAVSQALGIGAGHGPVNHWAYQE